MCDYAGGVLHWLKTLGCPIRCGSIEGGLLRMPFIAGGRPATAVVVLVSTCAAVAIACCVTSTVVSNKKSRRMWETIGKSHLLAAKRRHKLVREGLRKIREARPDLRRLASEKHIAPEDKAKEIKRQATEATAERRRQVQEELQAKKASNAELCAVLEPMRAKLAFASTPEGRAAMEQELRKETEALTEVGVDALAPTPDGSVSGFLELCATMTEYYQERCRRDEQEAKSAKEECGREVAAALGTTPGEENIPQRRLLLQIVAVNAEIKGDHEASRKRVHQLDCQVAALKVKEGIAVKEHAELQRTLEGLEGGGGGGEEEGKGDRQEKDEGYYAELKDYTERAPALLKYIEETEKAIEEVKQRAEEFARQERELERVFK